MKKTEQRWMHISTGLLVERGRKPDNSANDYRPVTVTWDEPEYEDVEVVMWLASDGKTFLLESYALDHQATLTDGQIVELRGTYRRRKPEPEPEAWESHIRIGALGNYVGLPSSATDHGGKKVRVEVI